MQGRVGKGALAACVEKTGVSLSSFIGEPIEKSFVDEIIKFRIRKLIDMRLFFQSLQEPGSLFLVAIGRQEIW